MKREVEREARLPAFALSLDELELLWKRMSAVFSGNEGVRKSISLSVPHESLEFESIDELRAYSELRGQVTNFSVSMRRDGETIIVRSGSVLVVPPTLVVRGYTDLWCASAVEAVIGVIKRNRTWYWWLTFLNFTSLLYGSLFGVGIVWLSLHEVSLNSRAFLVWCLALLTLGYTHFNVAKLLPQAAIVVSIEHGFLRRYASEIGLAIALISLVAAVLMWMFPTAS